MSGATPARRLALGVLADVEVGRRLSERLAQPDAEALDPRERAFLHELTLGTLRRRGALDHALAAFIERPFARVDPAARHVLRLGAYQLLHMRVPDRAAVSQAVELARDAVPRAAGFVNAVLRRLAREGPPPAPDPRREPLAWLATAGSLPEWLAARWLAHLGASAAVARAQALLEAPPTTFRTNPRRPDATERLAAAGVEARALQVPGAWEAVTGDLTALAREGFVYAQDQGSQLVAHLAAGTCTASLRDAGKVSDGKSALAAGTCTASLRDAGKMSDGKSALAAGTCTASLRDAGKVSDGKSALAAGTPLPPGERDRAGTASLLDACAAPGGKTALAADQLGPAARIVAAEASWRRLRTAADLLARWGATGVRLVAADARRPPFRTTFDTVLVDAPCSGLGTLARHPDLRWRIRADDLPRQAERQAALLQALAPFVAPGGRLVYAVCSLEPEEGVERVRAFLDAQPAFTLDAQGPEWTAPFADGPWLGTRPERDGGDGFFAAVLRRA